MSQIVHGFLNAEIIIVGEISARIDNFFSLEHEHCALLLLEVGSEVDLSLSNGLQEFHEVHLLVVPGHSVSVELLPLILRNLISVGDSFSDMLLLLSQAFEILINPFLE